MTAQPLNPIGFKIALELLLKTQYPGLAEVPYSFAKRRVGSSKLGPKNIVKYVSQLASLYRWRSPLLFPIFVEICLIAGIYLASTLLSTLVMGWRARSIQTMQSKRKRRHDV